MLILLLIWRFHTGDDPRWADPGFDDSGWETVNLTPTPAAHDPDVGLTGYVTGWTAKGHPGYSGAAWYRVRVTVDSAPGDTVAITGPTQVDDRYDLFVNGVRVGGGGRPYSIQPRLFLPPPFKTAVVAIRVFASPATVKASPGDAGGIHIAPAIGPVGEMRNRYSLEWSETVNGYVIDAIEGAAFLALAVIAFGLRAYWMGIGLIAMGILRGQQAVFAWFQFERIEVYVLMWRFVAPIMLGAWVLAWRDWFGLRRPPAIPIAVLALLMMIVPQLRLAFLVVTVIVFALGGRRQPLALLAAVLGSIALFAPEVSALHIPGIWFPYGVGVSRSEYASAAFDVVMLALFAWTTFNSLPATSRSTS